MAETLEVLQQALAGRYRVERELGHGGMATVFLAEDLKHHRRVAIKVLEPEVASALGSERFLREIETAAQLAHPHILPLFDSGEGGGLLYYVMPYVSGESLRQRLKREPQLPVAEAQRIAEQVADALDYAHAHGVVHRDIKPENILLEGTQAIVADFGIARAVVGAGAGRLTTAGITVGTPAYMSPEQASGDAVDARSDVYSLGCVVYELLAGEPPYTGPTGASLIRQHLSAPVPDVARLRPGVGAATSGVLKRALAKSPEERFATATALVRALAAGTAGAVTPEASTSAVTAGVPATGRFAGRRARWALGGAFVAVIALVAMAAWQEWWPFGGRAAAPTAKKDWILVADFDGPPGDSTLAPAARSLLSAALDQSRIVATVTNDQIQEALQTAGKPPSTRLTPAVAKELAYRSAVRTVLEGSIGKLGTGYSVVVRLVDADSARVLFTESATAKGDDALIPAMGELAKKLRRELGENRRGLAATRPMVQIATPSFEAYKLYVQAGLRFGANTAIRERIRAYRAAVALDPDFASAFLGMVYPYMYMGFSDSAQASLDEACATPSGWCLSSATWPSWRWPRCRGTVRAHSPSATASSRTTPGTLRPCTTASQDLGALGRYEEALDQVHRVMKLSPFGPTEGMRLIETACYMCTGQID